MATETTLKPCIELFPNGIKKLETFFKIASTKDDTAFIEINPQDNVIKLNCMDPAHVTQTIHIIDSEENGDFLISGLDKILQFNINVRDFNKILTLNADKDLKIYPNLDENNNFDMIRIHVIENKVHLKEIFIPIHEATHSDLFQLTIDLVNRVLNGNDVISINMDLTFLNEILKDSEIFMNDRLRFNVSLKDKTISSLSIETFDDDTDKTRRIKTNLFAGLHFNISNVNISDSGLHNYSVLVSFPELKKILVTSKIFTDVKILISNKNPICIMYEIGSYSTVDTTLTTLLAPMVINQEEQN